MNKTLLPAAFLPLLTATTHVVSADDNGKLEQMSVTASRVEIPQRELGVSVSIVTATDIDTTFLGRLRRPNLEVRQLDVTKDPIGEGYDLVCARALLHHIPERLDVTKRLAAAVKPGGFILLEEPDFHSVLATDSPAVRNFWSGFIAWAANCGIDYSIGRRIAPALDQAGMTEIDAHGETIMFQGGSA